MLSAMSRRRSNPLRPGPACALHRGRGCAALRLRLRCAAAALRLRLGWTGPAAELRLRSCPERKRGEAMSDASAPNGNGDRHCCQSPLRRAKDMPVFVTLDPPSRSSLVPVFDPCAPAQASLPNRDPNPLDLHPGTGSLPFHGPSWGNHSCVLLRLHLPEGKPRPHRARDECLFRRLVPADYRVAPERASQLPAGRRSVFLPLPPRRVAPRWRLRRPPRSPDDYARPDRFAKADSVTPSLWITGIWRISREHRGTGRGCPNRRSLLPPT